MQEGINLDLKGTDFVYIKYNVNGCIMVNILVKYLKSVFSCRTGGGMGKGTKTVLEKTAETDVLT